MRLLLVEDSSRLRSALEKGLRKAGYAVDVAKDGREGLWLGTENEYDVIVLDLMLPEIDGLTVLHTLRERGKSTHVLILSARDLVEDRIRGLRNGADDYLVKPFSFDELCARLEALVRRTYQAKNPVIRTGPLELNTVLAQGHARREPRGAAHPPRVQPPGDPDAARRRGPRPPRALGAPLRLRLRDRQQRRRRPRLLAAQEARSRRSAEPDQDPARPGLSDRAAGSDEP